MKFTKGHRQAGKLNGEQVLRIRELYGAGYSQGSLARTFQVTIGTIGRIVRGESWQGIANAPEPLVNPPDLGALRLAQELGITVELELAKCPHGSNSPDCPECRETMAKFGLGGGK